MDNKTTPLSETAEYKFTDPEDVGGEGEGESADVYEQPVAESTESVIPPKFDFLKNIPWHRFLVPGIVVISILLVYVGFDLYSSRTAELAEQKKITAQSEAVLTQKPEMIPKPASIESPETQIKPREEFGEIDVQAQQVQQEQSAIQKKIDSLIQQMAGDQKSISSLNDSVTKIEQDMSAVSQYLEQLAAAMQEILVDVEKIKTSLKKPKKKPVKPLVPYHVRAIVPGRVWLESAKGKNVTLRVGDKLEGYGVVRIISPRQGMIIMSNGSIIQYGVNDF